jgi:hypothetical protein
MASFTSSSTGNWSSSGTWSGAGVPGAGDTVTIGAHTVTVDVPTIIGTSPNNTTTAVIDMTSASSVLIVGSALTVRGNLGMVSGSTLSMVAGSSVVWDASASGGTPVYKIINSGFCKLVITGTNSSHCTMSAPVGFTFQLEQNYSQLEIAYCDFTRHAAFTGDGLKMGSSVGFNVQHNTFTACGFFQLNSTNTNQDFLFNYNTFTNSGADCFKLALNAVPTTSNPRQCIGNSFDTAFTYISYGVEGRDNYFGGGIDGVADHPWGELRHSTIVGTRADGQLIEGIIERNYFTSFSNPNPHFIEARANVADVIFQQNIFESHDADTSDFGDCILPVNDRFTVPFKWVIRNNLVLRNSFAPTGSGTLITLYATGSTDVVTEHQHNTCNVDNPAAGAYARRSAFATSEAGNSGAGNIAKLKSNLVWGTSPGQGYLAERVNNHAQLDVITAAQADYNWTHNLSAGNNQRYYHDQVSGMALWTAGDAVAAGLDTHQGTGDPQFYDRNRNIASWAQDRGYGSTYADGLTAIRAVPSRTADLVAYVFEGFRPGNFDMRNAAHDGGCPGAANFWKSDRDFAQIITHRTSLSRFGIS